MDDYYQIRIVARKLRSFLDRLGLKNALDVALPSSIRKFIENREKKRIAKEIIDVQEKVKQYKTK